MSDAHRVLVIGAGPAGLAAAYRAAEHGLRVTVVDDNPAAGGQIWRGGEETAESSEPVQITGRKGNSVLISERDWRALQETVYLLSVPGMRESIREGLETPIEECSEDPGW